jgi:hypothetical protein
MNQTPIVWNTHNMPSEKKINITKTLKSFEVLAVAIVIASVTHVLLLWIGVRRSFSGVPFWDEWDSRYRFYTNFLQDPLNSLLEQHNEHRIVLTKLLFLLDFWIFDGAAAPLIVLNLILSVAISTLVCRLLIQYMKTKNNTSLTWIICPLVFALNSSWLQQGNFTWAFQSQYFLVVILPLVLFNHVIRGWVITPKRSHVFLVFLLAILSSWTISGGILAIPVLIIISILNGRPKKEIFLLFVTFMSISLLYLFNFKVSKNRYETLFEGYDTLKSVVNFFFTYLSSPLIETFGFSYPVSIIIFLVVWGSALLILYRSRKPNNLANVPSNVLLVQLLFILGLASVTSLGRFQFGIEQATVAMYKTPSIVGWVISLSVLLIAIHGKLKTLKQFVPLLVLGILLASLPLQQRAVVDFSQWVNSFKLSAVALKLGVQDIEQLELIYYDYAQLIDYSMPFVGDEFAPFSSIGFSREEFSKRKISLSPIEKICVGNIDSQKAIDSSYLKLSGWISGPQDFDKVLSSSANEIYLLDSKGIVYGFGLQGFIREDVAKEYPLAKYSGFFVYAQRKIYDGDLFLYSQSYQCKLPISVGEFD